MEYKEALVEQITIMQACADGKEIEYRPKWTGYTNPLKWEPIASPGWNWEKFEYRVRPEKEYRPYGSLEEFAKGYLEHGQGNVLRNKYDTLDSELPCIIFVDRLNPAAGCYGRSETNMEELFTNYTWPDGTPCGIEVSD